MDGNTALIGTVTLVEMHCGSCSMVFAAPYDFYLEAKNNGVSFRCPNPKCDWASQHYVESEIERLRKELQTTNRSLKFERERADRARKTADSARRSAAATRGHYKRMKTRVSHGVCPCCNRTFQNLMRHMATKHPTYKETENGQG